MGDDNDLSWREKGVTNWARDHGLVMTRDDSRYTLWLSNPLTLVLADVALDEVESYLEAL